MNIEEIKKVVKKELFKSFDKESINMVDAFLISECIRETLIAINYTRCSTELKAIEDLKDLAYEVCPLHRTDDLDEIIERL